MKNWTQGKSALLTCVCAVMMLTLSGCVYLVVGGLGALGGYVISPDTVEGVTSADYLDVWDETIEVVSIMGIIQEQQEAGGVILAKVNGAKVTINIIQEGSASTKMRIKARKAFFPKVSVAQDVYIKVMSNLE